MGYRGSKSDLNSRFVKEQRVDGSYFSVSIFDKLRCTLMECESNYPVSNPSKLIIIPTYKVPAFATLILVFMLIPSFALIEARKRNCFLSLKSQVQLNLFP